MLPIDLKLFGGLTISQGGAPLADIRSQKGQALLCYLAVTRKHYSRSTLAGMMWSDLPEENALTNLRKVLYRLKPLVGYLVIERDMLSFNINAPYTLDVNQFRSATHDLNDIYRLQYAASLYTGDFLEGFHNDDSPLFEEWVTAERASLRETALICLQNLATFFARQQDYPTAITYQQKLLFIDAWNEAAHRDLIQLLLKCGQRSAALQQYDFCRDILATELGVEPSAETRKLVTQIYNGEWDHPPIPVLYNTSCPNNLLAQSLPFVGREHELAVLKQYLENPDIRLLTILGPGGIGKTSLVLAAARLQIGNRQDPQFFPQGVYFVSLAGRENPALLLPAIAEVLSFRFVEGVDPSKQLLRFLQKKTMLLVLDNYEHMLGGIQLINEILQTAQGIKILITSREKLNLQAEFILPLSGMSYPKEEPAKWLNGRREAMQSEDNQVLMQYSAIQLFVQYARRVRLGFAVTAENQAAVLSICRLVQGMPLGIVLAAAWCDILTPEEIMQEIYYDVDFLKTDYGDVPSRQRSLRAAFHHTWRMVSDLERDLFRKVSVFRGSFTRQAAQAVADATLQDLQQLVNKSLLLYTGEGRYEVHELLRQFAAEELARMPEDEAAVRDRHCAYYCDFLQAYAQDWHTGKLREVLAIVQENADNIQSAWNWAVRHGNWQHLIKAIDGWGYYHELRGRFIDGESIFRTIAETAGEQVTNANNIDLNQWCVWAKALTWQGRFTREREIATQLMKKSLVIWDRLERIGRDTRQERAFSFLNISNCYYFLDRKKAREYGESGLALYQDFSDPWGTSWGLLVLGRLDWATGKYIASLERLQAGLRMTQTLGNTQEQIFALESLSWLYKHLGRVDEAEQLCRQAVQMSQQLNDAKQLIETTADLALALWLQGQYSEARQWAETSLTNCLEYGHFGQEGYCRLVILMCLLFNGEYTEANNISGLTLTRTREAHIDGVEATVHWSLGCLALARSDWGVAEVEFQESRRLYEAVQDNMLGFALAGLAFTACLTGQIPKAQQILGQSLKTIIQMRDWLLLELTLPAAALLHCKTGNLEKAVILWILAKRMPLIKHSKWYADVVETHMNVAGAGIPTEINKIPQTRGNMLDLWEIAENLYCELSSPL